MRKATVGLLVMLAVAGIMTDATGDEFKLIPSVAVRQEFNDNIFYSSRDEEDDFITTVAGKMELSQRTERLDLNLTGQVAPFWYWDNTDLDAVDQEYRGRIGYDLTPQFSGRADGHFIIDHRPDRDIVSTGLVQNVDRRKQYHIGAGFNHKFTEVFSTDVSYDFDKDDWDEDVLDREDFRGNNANLQLIYDLGRWWEPTIAWMNFGYANYKYDTSKTDIFTGSLGGQHWFSETFNALINVGARYDESDFDVPLLVFVPPAGFQIVTVQESNSDWGVFGRAVFEYQGDRSLANLLVSHDLAPASGRLGPTQLTKAVFRASYRLLEKLRIGLSAGYYRNRADSGDFSTQDINEDTYRIWPSIDWEFYENFTLKGAYYYTYVDDNDSDTTIKRHQAYLELAYALPLMDLLDY